MVFFFDNTRANLLVYFSVTTIILYFGPENILPSLKRSKTENVPIISSASGKISGTMLTSTQGRNIFAYRSIPYAQPPIGDLRFKKPKAVEPWNGVLEAHYMTPACGTMKVKCLPQKMNFNMSFPSLAQPTEVPFRTMTGQEDCLYLNVFVPETGKGADFVCNPFFIGFQYCLFSEVKDLPVMVWFHGGGFVSGQASMYGPEHLMDRDIILVTVSYRLGPLGFFSLGKIYCWPSEARPTSVRQHNRYIP